MNNILTLANSALGATDIVAEGLKTTVIGIGIVFAVLILLWAVLTVMHKVFEIAFGNKQNPKETPPPQATPPVQQTTAAPATTVPANDNGKLIAVITAAISTYRQQSGQDGNFRVVSFRRR